MQFLEKLNRKKVLTGSFMCLCLLLCSCNIGGGFNYDQYSDRNGEYRELFKISKADMNEEYSDTAQVIDLDECSGQVAIVEPGDYVIRGKLYGSLVVDSEDGNVHIIFDGVDISAINGPAVYIKSAGKVILTLAENSDNFLSDSTDYDDYKDSKACLYSYANLTINGSGNLNVYSYVVDGIRTPEILKILGGHVYVLAKKSGIRGNEGVYISTDELKLECEGYGVVTVISANGEAGDVQIKAGQINITTGKQPIKSKGDLYITHPAEVSIYSVIPDFSVGSECYIEEGAVN